MSVQRGHQSLLAHLNPISTSYNARPPSHTWKTAQVPMMNLHKCLVVHLKSRVCEYPFPNTSQTWSCPCISSSTRQQPTFACSLGQQDVSSAASNSAEKCISEQQLVCISLKLTGFAVCSQLVPVGIILHVLFDHQRAVWTVKLFERPQRGVNINPNNHKCQKMESSTQIRFKRHHSSKARVELKQYICISASSSWPATCSHLSSPPDLIPKIP